jgi:type III secretory pathway component EscU
VTEVAHLFAQALFYLCLLFGGALVLYVAAKVVTWGVLVSMDKHKLKGRKNGF